MSEILRQLFLIRATAARKACLLLVVLAASAQAIVAIPLATYRERVRQSILALDSLQTMDESADELENDMRVAQTLAEVRKILPPSEIVEWDDSALQVDNKWLEASLQNYENMVATDPRRRLLLTEVTERLSALADTLAELENPQAQTAGSKDEEKARLEAILRREAYAKKATEESALARLWKRFTAWLRSLFPDSSPQLEPGQASAFSKIAQIFVFALALAVIAYVVWKLWPRLWRGLRKEKKTKKREARVVLGEHLEPDQTSADLLAEAEALAREGQLRAAIRKGYIALLCELGDRKVLGLAQHKTNRDYLRAVRHQEPLYKEMQHLTYSFENHWYGFVPASMEDWNIFRSRYQQALEKQG